MNKETKAVVISGLLLLIGATFIQFSFIPIGATIMGLGGFGVMFGPALVNH
jgi:hypothetical protein